MIIAVSTSEQHWQDLRTLFVEYQTWLGISLCFQNFDQELERLQQIYAPPQGFALVAYHNHLAVGCIALKPLETGVAELKRLFVKPEARGLGIGSVLVRTVINMAPARNYRAIRLDSLSHLTQALSIYRSVGFYETTRYNDNPLKDVVFMELKLNPKH
jgi:ribosomal protein S18 acetylase RimI-like enzyme